MMQMLLSFVYEIAALRSNDVNRRLQNFHSTHLSLIGKLSVLIVHEGEIRKRALSAAANNFVAAQKFRSDLECKACPCN